LDQSHRRVTIEAALLIALWAQTTITIGSARGLFDWLGVDYALYATGATLLGSADPASVYDLGAIADRLRVFAPYYGPHADPLKVGPLPYLAPTFLVYAPFATLAPPVGFALWALVNLLLSAIVVRDGVARFDPCPCPRTVLLLTFFPLAYAIFVGQPVVVLLFAFWKTYRAFEDGRDWQAGLWASGLLLKVQYPLILGFVLLVKRRWRALGGLAIAGTILVLASLAIYGPEGLWAFARTLRSMSGFRKVHSIVYPEQMINWRGLLVNLLPSGVSEARGTALTLILSVLTASSLIVVWRGRWDPSGPRFASQMLATVLVMLLTAFHSHLHGAALLLVPGLALWGQGSGSKTLRIIILLSVYLPTCLFALRHDPHAIAFLFLALMLAALGVIIASEWSSQRTARQ
jgi:hypothetical protein